MPLFNRLLHLYSLIIISLLTLTSLVSARSLVQIGYALLFAPLVIYFIRRLRSRPRTTFAPLSTTGQAASHPITSQPDTVEGETLDDGEVADINKRLFLRLIGSAGLATFIFALFKRDAQAAFFGSVPGPGTVALKDTSGNKIDPAEKQPTDGYEISNVDDASFPSYYGFVNKYGAWYIAQESSAGAFRYVTGTSGFSTNWTNRAGQIYSTFDAAF